MLYPPLTYDVPPERDDDLDFDAEREGELLQGTKGQNRPPAECRDGEGE